MDDYRKIYVRDSRVELDRRIAEAIWEAIDEQIGDAEPCEEIVVGVAMMLASYIVENRLDAYNVCGRIIKTVEKHKELNG